MQGASYESGVRQPPIRAFVDDLTTTVGSVVGTRWILAALERLNAWGRLDFKASKSRSLVIVDGKVTQRFSFSIAGAQIQQVTDKPVKSLGKWFDSTLSDKVFIKDTVLQLSVWFSEVDKTGLPGKFKAWMFQHGILPRIMWPLLVYEIPITTIVSMEAYINRYLRKWLGLPRSFSSVGFYSSTCRLQLPLTSLVEEYKVCKVRKFLTIRDSGDECVAKAGVREKNWQNLERQFRGREHGGSSAAQSHNW